MYELTYQNSPCGTVRFASVTGLFVATPGEVDCVMSSALVCMYQFSRSSSGIRSRESSCENCPPFFSCRKPTRPVGSTCSGAARIEETLFRSGIAQHRNRAMNHRAARRIARVDLQPITRFLRVVEVEIVRN